MKSKRSALFCMIAVLACLGFASVVAAIGIMATAKTAFQQAQEAAQKWQADAALVQVSSLSGDMDGTADKWTFLFYSPKAKKAYRVDVKDAQATQTLEVSSSFFTEPISDFIDSTQAMAEAKKNGLKGKGRSMMTLNMMLKGTQNHGAYWNLVGDMAAGKSTLVDAKTGKFFRHQALQ